jgi:hypothetical protein
LESLKGRGDTPKDTLEFVMNVMHQSNKNKKVALEEESDNLTKASFLFPLVEEAYVKLNPDNYFDRTEAILNFHQYHMNNTLPLGLAKLGCLDVVLNPLFDKDQDGFNITMMKNARLIYNTFIQGDETHAYLLSYFQLLSRTGLQMVKRTVALALAAFNTLFTPNIDHPDKFYAKNDLLDMLNKTGDKDFYNLRCADTQNARDLISLCGTSLPWFFHLKFSIGCPKKRR